MIDQESIIWDKLSGGIVGNDRPGAQDLRDSRLDSKLRVGRPVNRQRICHVSALTHIHMEHLLICARALRKRLRLRRNVGIVKITTISGL